MPLRGHLKDKLYAQTNSTAATPKLPLSKLHPLEKPNGPKIRLKLIQSLSSKQFIPMSNSLIAQLSGR